MDDSSVLFSSGSKATKAQLYARVCRYVQNRDCINQDKTRLGYIAREDGFPSEEDTQNSFRATNFTTDWKLFRT